jgi:hypothetical protein
MKKYFIAVYQSEEDDFTQMKYTITLLPTKLGFRAENTCSLNSQYKEVKDLKKDLKARCISNFPKPSKNSEP